MHFDSKNRFSNILLFLALSLLSFSTELGASDLDQNNTLSCHGTVNVSLNQNCSAIVDVEDILTSVPPATVFTIQLMDKFGDPIPNATVDGTHIGEPVTAKVTQVSNGNSCWSNIVVEDKMAPTIICNSFQVDCFDNANFEPVHFDNCRSSELRILDQVHEHVECDPDIAKRIITVYVAEDVYGNVSLPCQQVVSIEHLDLDLIVFPPSYELINNTNLVCTDVEFDENGFPLYEDTGVPTYNMNDLNPGAEFCNVFVEYEDLLLTTDGCFRKYMRTWRVFQEICGNFTVEMEQQVIEFADTEDPEIVCPLPITVNTDGTVGCDAFVQLELAEYSDDCSDVIEMDIVTPVGFFNNVTEAPAINLNVGVNEIQYTVYDACENPATCATTITVLDNAPPVARCDKSTVVSLRSDGTALAMSPTFDEGSFDDCSLYKTLIRRTEDVCGCPAPIYDDMEYVGERNGHYYYISTIDRFGFEAFVFSTAMGGSILVTETLEEHEWVNEKIRENTDVPYLVGLKDKDTTGVYRWPDHTLSNLDLWEPGFPQDDIYVVVNEDGNWETADATLERYAFVFELDDPCGFSDRVYFCCEDAGQDVPLVLRVVDRAGRFNDCELTTEIQDKIAPDIVCPQSIVLDCSVDVDTSMLEIYGMASATDQCFVNIESSYVSNVNECGIGQIIRTFTASDANGQNTCDQILSFEMTGNPVEVDIDWPDDYDSDLGCLEGDLEPENLPEEFAYPDFSATDCSILVASHSDQVFSFTGVGDDACFKVIRTWTVEDQCLIGQQGYTPLQYQQVLKIGNSTAPTLETGCDPLIVNTADCNEADVSFLLDASDDCTESDDLRGSIQVDVDSDGNGVFDIEDLNIRDLHLFEATLPVGNHFALIEYRDQCGNASTCTKIITVETTKGPTAVCVPGLVTTLQAMDLNGDNDPDTTMVVLIPDNLDAYNESLMVEGSHHDCGFDISLSFSDDPNDQTLVFTCDDLESDNVVSLWVTDVFGNTSVCQTIVEVTDPNNACDQNTAPRYEIEGEIFTEDLVSLSGVEVSLVGSESGPVMTDENGNYAFPAMPSGSLYSVQPIKNDNPLDGVSTLDILKIQRHVLGLEPLDSSYKIIAADIDKSGSITARDMIELRKLILGVYDEFPENTSWVLIDNSQKFLDSANPLIEEIRETYDIYGLDNSMKIDFIGIKTGDVDNSNSVSAGAGVSQRSLNAKMYASEKLIQKGTTSTIQFKLDGKTSLNGIQFELDFDTEYCSVIGVQSESVTLDITNFNADILDQGKLRVSWSDVNPVELTDETLFSVVIKSNRDAMTSDIVELSEKSLKPEVYFESDTRDMQLSFVNNETDSEIELYQNTPNPFTDQTEIKYHIPSRKEVRFSVYDINGRLLYRQIGESQVGVNSIVVDRSQLSASGIMYYEIVVEGQRYINKMILLD